MWQKKALDFDQQLRVQWAEPASLCPTRKEAHTLSTLGLHLQQSVSEKVAAEVMFAVVSIAQKQLQCFPDNIFWDFDGLMDVVSQLQTEKEREDCVARFHSLYTAFSQGQLRFQYAHDLIYGFDWARWVQKDSEKRQHIGPFDMCFLERMLQRHQELLEELSQGGSQTYPYINDLDHDQGYRNPFGFSRSQDDEKRIMNRLAEDGSVPVAFWLNPLQYEWNQPFEQRRKQVAQDMGMP